MLPEKVVGTLVMLLEKDGAPSDLVDGLKKFMSSKQAPSEEKEESKDEECICPKCGAKMTETTVSVEKKPAKPGLNDMLSKLQM